MAEKQKLIYWIALASILVIAAFMRLYGIHWDEGFPYTPHPDERAILMKAQDMHFPKLDQLGSLLDSEKSPLNPRWFPYGTFPIYVLKIKLLQAKILFLKNIALKLYTQ